MKPVWTILAAAMAVVASAMAFAQSEEATSGEAALPSLIDLRQVTPVRGDPVAGKQKAELCSACHGTHGIAVVSLFPNLPGQHIDYLYWRLVAFKQGHFPESPMTPPALSLSDTDMRDLAAFYASLDPVAAQRAMDADPDAEPVVSEPAAPAVLARGEQLYRSGDPAKGIPPCQGCHGADVRGYNAATRPHGGGRMPFAAFPSLRHQHRDYLQTRLDAFRQQQRHATSNDLVMAHVGNRLDEESIQALAAWLSALPPG
ncbi:MAG TPA: c-type cytochrome [Pseudoxanthomonas sp.]|nr:c-type cytochrome [Pseudoxanthomonas sp.]